MSSGIGAYAPRYMQDGGDASLTSGLDDVQSGNAAGRTPLTFEQFIANATTGPGGLINGKTKQEAYDAYIAAFYGGFPGFPGGLPGQRGGSAGVNTKTLPSYLTVEGGLVRIDPSATNLQFINFLNDLGFFSDKEYDGLTDYEWFVEATKDNPDETWISQLFNDPNRDFVVDGDFATRSGYNITNLERFRRLADLINPASQAGGVFQAPQTFLNKYGGGLGLNVNRGDGQAGRPRQVFIGQRPTGLGLDPNTGQPSAQQPFYTQSDILVDSTEQPNLYTFNINPDTGVGQFDPMVTTTTVNPFDTPATPLSTSYTSPETTPTFESDVNFSDVFANVVTPDKVRAFYRRYLGRDPGVNQYVMQFVESGKTLDQIETEIMNSPEAQNFSITGTPVSSAEELAQIIAERNAVTPEKVRGFYQQYLGRDPGNNEFVMGWVNSGMSLADVEAQIAASPEAQNFATTGIAAQAPPPVTLQSVQDLYQKNLGRQGAEEYVMNWVNSGMSLAEIDEAIQNSPEGVSYSSNLASTAAATRPNVMSQDRVQTDNVTTLSTSVQDPVEQLADTTTVSPAPPPTTNEQGIPIGPTGLTTTQAAIQALEERRKREAAAANTGAGGFATGGIVGLTDGMNLEANSGQGLESFLRSRSKAALRRNLAKVAPRPTMQTGIMPMAR
ncbi:hypothetical protein [Hyphomonas sp.]|uniref:hypothetical protein n=1 Tax=Hyphomonas sp. TaxID=87 RepID=UPI0025B9BF3B|nr:hypothetical protein [Hyphomonas sp.]